MKDDFCYRTQGRLIDIHNTMPFNAPATVFHAIDAAIIAVLAARESEIWTFEEIMAREG